MLRHGTARVVQNWLLPILMKSFTMPPALPVDSNLCPLCGQTNQCAMEVERSTGVPQPPCWCSQLTFDAALLARIPEPARGKACVCAACVGAAAPMRQV